MQTILFLFVLTVIINFQAHLVVPWRPMIGSKVNQQI